MEFGNALQSWLSKLSQTLVAYTSIWKKVLAYFENLNIIEKMCT